MKLNFKLAAVFSAMSLAAVPAAFAQQQEEVSGFYIGAGAGQFNAQIDDVDQLDNTVDSWDEDDTAYKVFGGYRVNRFLAFELDYINLGEPSGAVVPGFNVDLAVDGFECAVCPFPLHFPRRLALLALNDEKKARRMNAGPRVAMRVRT